MGSQVPLTVDISVSGMTCGACVARVERKLNRLDGVEATVNLAAERAHVSLISPSVNLDDVVAAIEAAGYGARVIEREELPQAGDRLASLRRRANVAAALAIPVAALSYLRPLRFHGWQQAQLAAATAVVAWAGMPFHQAALSALRRRTATMDTLVSLGSLAAFAAGGTAVLRRHDGHAYLDVAVGLVASQLSGRVLEEQARSDAGAAVRSLVGRQPRQAAVLDPDGRQRRVPVEQLAVGDRFLVLTGETIAADGIVEDGASSVDQSMMTGESLPVDVTEGSRVAGGAVNMTSPLVVRATRIGADSALAAIARLVISAQAGKPRMQRSADRIAALFVPAVIATAAGTYFMWRRTGHAPGDALRPAVSVLVAACPCAMGLATPVALMAGTGRGAQLGIFIRSLDVLDAAEAVDTVVLDKTGTITAGHLRVTDVTVAPGADASEVLALAGGVEEVSEHPVGRAIAIAAESSSGQVPAVASFTRLPGVGVQGEVSGRIVAVGSVSGLGKQGFSLSSQLQAAASSAEERSQMAVGVGWAGEVRGVLTLSDAIKPTSADAVASLRQLGLRTMLLTGDHDRAARDVAASVGIQDYIAGVTPDRKVEVIRDLQRAGRIVAMIGDGINDAPALAQANLGIAVGTGTDVAVMASDLTLAGSDLRGTADAIRLARSTSQTIRQNLAWAFAYNAVTLPLAAVGRLSPVAASVGMAGSSLAVVWSAQRLSRMRSLARQGAQPNNTIRGQNRACRRISPAVLLGADGAPRAASQRHART